MCKTIKQKVKFHAAPERVYDLLADSKLHSKFSGAKAEISKKVGGAFTLQNGQVTGLNVELIRGVRIVQAWRAADFGAGIFSMASFELSPTSDGGTQLTLTHRGVPKELIPRVEEDWRESFWKKMKAVL